MTLRSKSFTDFDATQTPSPCFVVDEIALESNLQILQHVAQASGATILLALKAFSMFDFAPLIRRYLSGCCASSVHEARLAREEFGGEVHTFCAGYSKESLAEVIQHSDHVVFNSLSQWSRFKDFALQQQQHRFADTASPLPDLSFGLRVNPKHSEGANPIYDPCAPCSRLGATARSLSDADLSGIDGLHFHTLCEQGFEPLDRTLSEIEAQFADWLPKLKWVNFGGGHHITQAGYNIDGLIERIKRFRERYDVQVYLEPGEAIAINTGIMVAEVLDIIHNDMDIAIIDSSATCHMPDVLEMPYTPSILGATALSQANAGDSDAHRYRIGGMTCLAGDVIGDYRFEQALTIGQRIIFDDMSHYTMVKTNTFNGITLPSIARWNSRTNDLKVVKQFGYNDFKSRLS